jgi:hypothetical protein
VLVLVLVSGVVLAQAPSIRVATMAETAVNLFNVFI